MASNMCKVPRCTGKGHLEKNGKRYFIAGYCNTHYERNRAGKPLDIITIRDHRPSIIEGAIAKIPIGLNAKDGYAIVDKEFAWLDKYRWCVNIGGYAIRNLTSGVRFMHHEIVGKPEGGLVVDHINRNVLDNRSSNLRVVTQKTNARNSSLVRNGTNPYTGIGLSTVSNKWISRITVHDKNIYLGQYDDLEEAISARLFGECIFWEDKL